jgi:putative DNA primase/helicase
LLALWLDFEAFRERALKLCPWPDPRPARAAPPPRRATPYTGPSVIAAFNSAHDPVALLAARGYQRVGTRRWKSPDGHGASGVVLLPDGKVFCHHQSDLLGDGKPHDCFDLYVAFEHNGDQRAAVKAAAQLLGIESQRGAHGR